jgi:hypothetical protein
MDNVWVALIASTVAMLGALFGYLKQKYETKQITELAVKSDERNRKLTQVLVDKNEYIGKLEYKIIEKAGAAELAGILNSLHQNRRD